MGDFKKLCSLIEAEIAKEVNKGSLAPDTIRTIGAGIDVIKDVKQMERDEKMDEQGYSGHYPERGYNIMPYYIHDGMPYDDGMSYARRRDSMGRFMRSRDSYDDGSYDDMSRSRRGYSRDEKIDTLERMMENAKNDTERESIRKLILQMENG